MLEKLNPIPYLSIFAFSFDWSSTQTTT